MMRSLFTTAAAILALASLSSANHDPPEISKEFSSNFEDKSVASVKAPTDMYFTPDNQYAFVTSKFGTIWRISVADMDDNKGEPEKVFEIPHPMCLNGARGLSGIAVHPEYPTKPYIYVFHNHDKFDDCAVSYDLDEGPVNRMSRYTLNSDLKSIDADSEVVMFETSRLGTQTHNSGDIAFGADGMVYVTVGESGSKKHKNDNGVYFPTANNVLLGSLVRLTEDGNIPEDNPFTPSQGYSKSVRCGLNGKGLSEDADVPCQEIYATGLRNPFRFAMDPNAAKEGKTRFFINDVGSNTWEMIKEGGDGMAGANYGYPIREGPCESGKDKDCKPDDDYTLPTYYYHHQEEHGGAITGGAFVPDDAGWPASLRGSYFYAEYAIGGIYAITPDESERCDYPECDPPVPAYRMEAFSQNKKVIGLSFGPHKGRQAMYYIVHLPSGRDGEGINRISYTGTSNRDPKAMIEASATVGFLPLTVSFDGTQSVDPDDGDTAGLTYEWDFDNDGNVDATGPTPSFEFTKPGVFNAKLTVRDTGGGSDSTTVRIDVDNSPPTPRILSPMPGTTFAVGDSLVLRGEAFDAEDGKLSDASLTWEVRQHHNNHYHPFLDPTTGNNIQIDDAPPPEDFHAYTTTRSYLAVHLTATDSAGLSSTTVVEVHPRMVNIKFDSEPSGMTVLLNAEKFTLPVSMIGWEGHKFELEAPVQVNPDNGSSMMSLQSWSEGEETGKTTVDYTVPAVEPSKPVVASFHPARPVPVIKGIDKDLMFSVGDSYELHGAALASDGVTFLSDSSLTWEVRLYNVDGDGYATLLAPTKGNKIAMPQIPQPDAVVFNHGNGRSYGEDAAEYNSPDAAGLGYLEILLTATDATGASDTTRFVVEPDIVEIKLDTKPSGLELRVDGDMVSTPTTVSTWRDHIFNVKAYGGYVGDTKYEWVQWSNGKTRSHKVKARSDETIIAEFDAIDSLPVPEIKGYREGRDTFRVGEEFVLTGSGKDNSGKELPYYALSWTVRLYSGGMDNNSEMTYRKIANEKGRDLYFEIPAPESFDESATGFIEVVLTAKDERDGLFSTKTLIMQPAHIDVVLTSDPSGLFVMANGEQIRTPITLTTWQKQVIQLDSPGRQKMTGTIYDWWSWSDEDGNAVYTAAHTYVVPRPKSNGEQRIVTANFGVGASPYIQSAQGATDFSINMYIVIAALVAVILSLALGTYLIYRKNKGIVIVDVSDDNSYKGADVMAVDETHTHDDSQDHHSNDSLDGIDIESSHHGGGGGGAPSTIYGASPTSMFGSETNQRDNKSPVNLLHDESTPRGSFASQLSGTDDEFQRVIMQQLNGDTASVAFSETTAQKGEVGLDDTVSDCTSTAQSK